MDGWLVWLFDASGFPARWHCGTWSAALGWSHIAADLTICFAYLGIPVVLLYLVRKRRDLPFLPVFWLFIVFIALCGLGHFVEAGMFWWPAYRFSAGVKVATAGASLATLVALVPFVQRALAMPGTTELVARLGRESSARRQSQQELHSSQEHLRMATMVAGIGLWEWLAEGDQLRLDDATRAMFGLPPGRTPVGKDFLLDCVRSEDRERVEAALRRSFAHGEPLAANFRIQRPDGMTVHLAARGAARMDRAGNVVGMAGAFLDVTKDEISRELFRIAVEASPNALLIVSRAGDIVLANSQAETVFGYPRAELVGMCVDRLVPPPVASEHAGLRDGYFAAPSHRRLGAGRDLTGVRKDGSRVPLEIALAPVQLDTGPGVLAAIVDITERMDLHAKLSQAERLAAVGELAAGVAHEINNPVNTMINCAQLAIDGDDPVENSRIVIEEGGRIAAIVRDLLQFARDDRGRAHHCSLVEVVSRCVRLLGENLKRHGVGLSVDLPADLPLVRGEPQQVQQVILNLLINAKDALLGRVQPAGRRVEITASRQEDLSVRCSIRDNGPGVPDELRERIFEPFVTTKRARGGTGLGLSISRNIIRNSGGTLTVDSVPGEYAEFIIVLPLANDDEGSGAG
jgi:PAS domain S-box-containing protein